PLRKTLPVADSLPPPTRVQAYIQKPGTQHTPRHRSLYTRYYNVTRGLLYLLLTRHGGCYFVPQYRARLSHSYIPSPNAYHVPQCLLLIDGIPLISAVFPGELVLCLRSSTPITLKELLCPWENSCTHRHPKL